MSVFPGSDVSDATSVDTTLRLVRGKPCAGFDPGVLRTIGVAVRLQKCGGTPFSALVGESGLDGLPPVVLLRVEPETPRALGGSGTAFHGLLGTHDTNLAARP